MADLVITGRPKPQEVAAIVLALRVVAAKPVAAPERVRRRRPVVLPPHPLVGDHGGRAWRLAPAGVV